MIKNEEWKRFCDWLDAKGDHPGVTLALRRIAEFDVYAEEDEEDYRWAKTLIEQRAPADKLFSTALEVLTWAEAQEAPHTRMRRFQDWLQLKGYGSTATLTQRWLAEFVEIKVKA